MKLYVVNYYTDTGAGTAFVKNEAYFLNKEKAQTWASSIARMHGYCNITIGERKTQDELENS